MFSSEMELREALTTPPKALIEMMLNLEGDISILGVSGKMGIDLAIMAKRACQVAKVDKRIIGVARFSNPSNIALLQKHGIETVSCDLSDLKALEKLETTTNVIFMAAKKFGSEQSESDTWVMNTLVPGYVARHFRDSRIVCFSTGCVYPLTTPADPAPDENTQPSPIGTYATTALGREMMFNHAAKTWQTKVSHFRLNYAIDLRYGVLHDICKSVIHGEVIDLKAGHFNCIWQGDAIAQALLCLEHCSAVPFIINSTGPETLSTQQTAEKFAKHFNTTVTFKNSPERTYLSNAGRAHQIFGYPSVSADTLIQWQAQWIQNDGVTLNKPTKFEVSDGKF